MTLQGSFEEIFEEEFLLDIFRERVAISGATGIDNLTQRQFWPIQEEQVEIISRKVLGGSYTFTKYKLKLVSKGAGKAPREISIPTIRDRITLRALCELLTAHLEDIVKFELPQDVVRRVKRVHFSGDYDAFVKLDIANFYPSVSHRVFRKKLRKLIAEPHIRDLVYKAISTPTVARSRETDTWNDIGIPQGLAISNILAAVYLLGIDSKYSKREDIEFFRYVDDILIFVKNEEAVSVSQEVISSFKGLQLTVHDPIEMPEKSKIGTLTDEFDYLGYAFHAGKVSVKKGSIEKLRESLVSIFTGYKYSKYKSEAFLEWRLNLRITGCIFDRKCRGWMFFFSEINDEPLLHSLDRHVRSLCKRFGVRIKPKKFSRSFYEVNHRRYSTNYVPDFDRYSDSEKRFVLSYYFGKNVSSLTDDEVDFEFRKRIDRQVKDLLQDVQDLS
ncbi:MAG: RNA-dependent DNA polymerase [Alteromonadaceae bacterium]|nr:RNA-dependent DNA polymerase [Alteromonadaceae bacterium]|tara:strand:- start:5289 stop:6617 length:1329 start_codon:yes stop_codon:yes gene_type:complete